MIKEATAQERSIKDKQAVYMFTFTPWWEGKRVCVHVHRLPAVWGLFLQWKEVLTPKSEQS